MFDIKVESWEDGEMIITINGEPIGHSLSLQHSVIVKNWLQGCQEELVDIISDEINDKRDYRE